MENGVIDLSSLMPAFCAVVGVVIGAKFGTRNENYLLKLHPVRKFLSESESALLKKIDDEVLQGKNLLDEYLNADESDAYKRFGIRLQLAEKLLDIETACETMITKLGFDKDSTNLLRMKVNQKNEVLDFSDPTGSLFDIERKRLEREEFINERKINQ